jgi:hypothetical protein
MVTAIWKRETSPFRAGELPVALVPARRGVTVIRHCEFFAMAD